jgi:hypothetical protein
MHKKGPILKFSDNRHVYVFDKNGKKLKPQFKTYINEKEGLAHYSNRAYYAADVTDSKCQAYICTKNGFEAISNDVLPKNIMAHLVLEIFVNFW